MKLFKRLFGNATETENQSGESHDTEPIKPSPFARPTSDLEDTKPVQALIANEEALPLADQRTKDLKEAQHAYMLTRIALKSARDEDKRAKERWQESQANAKHMEQAISFELDAISESMISHDDFDEWMRTYSPVQDALLSVSAWTKVKGVIESSDEILDLHMVDRISHPILREPTLETLRLDTLEYVNTRRLVKQTREADKQAKERWQTAQTNAPDMEEELQNSLLLLKAAASEVNELSQFPVNNIENSDIGGQVNHLYEMRLLDRSSNAESKVRDLLTAREYFDDVKAANVRKTRKTLPPVGSVRADDILAGTA